MDVAATQFNDNETLFEQVNDAVFILSLEGKHIRANQRAYDMLGYAPNELIGIGPKQLVAPREYPHSMYVMQRLLEGEHVLPYERTFVRKDGSEIHVEINVQLVREKDGTPRYFQSICRDISERKRAEIEIRLSEARFRHLISNLPIGVVQHGTQAEILLNNQAALHLLGLTQEQLLGKTSMDASWNVIHEDGSPFPGDTHPAVQALASGQPVRNVVMGVYRPYYQDRVWLLVNAEPEIGLDGKVRSVLVSFSDITEMRQAQERVVNSEKLFSTVFHANPIAIAISTLDDGRYLDANDAFLKLIDLPHEQVIGFTARELGFWPTWEDRQPVVDQLRREGRVLQMELQMRDRSGQLQPVLSSFELIDIDGKPHILSMNQNIADRKQAQEQAAELAAKDRTVDALRKYLGHISHDLRNPLAVMVTSLYLLKHKVSGSALEGLPQFEVLNRQVENVTRIVDHIAEMFRLEYKLDGLDMRPVSFSLLLEGVVTKLQSVATSKQQTITLHNSERALFVPGDAERLRRMVINLIENAMQYTPNAGAITVELCADGDGVRLTVSDTGIGIDAEHLPHIFDHFYRVDGARSSTEGSAGLGLTIVRKIVEAHGGTITVESTPGVGSVFRVWLPLVEG